MYLTVTPVAFSKSGTVSCRCRAASSRSSARRVGLPSRLHGLARCPSAAAALDPAAAACGDREAAASASTATTVSAAHAHAARPSVLCRSRAFSICHSPPLRCWPVCAISACSASAVSSTLRAIALRLADDVHVLGRPAQPHRAPPPGQPLRARPRSRSAPAPSSRRRRELRRRSGSRCRGRPSSRRRPRRRGRPSRPRGRPPPARARTAGQLLRAHDGVAALAGRQPVGPALDLEPGVEPDRSRGRRWPTRPSPGIRFETPMKPATKVVAGRS